MAFNMKRPIIEGTIPHKASVAKAKSTVAAYSPHSSGVLSGVDLYVESMVPHAIDYGLDMPKIDIEKKKKKKKKKKEEEEKVFESAAAERAEIAKVKFEEKVKEEGPVEVDWHDLLGTKDPTVKEEKSKGSPVEKRDDRVFKRGKLNGTVQTNMRKRGYVPPKER